MIYISGGITGIEKFEKVFEEAEKKLKNKYPNEKIINPVAISKEVEKKIQNPSYTDYMNEDIKILLECDTVFMLRGWERSKGASLEHHIAVVLEKNIIYQKQESVFEKMKLF